MKTPNRRRPNKKQQQKNRETSIEDIPAAILIHIISFLPIIDAIRTTAIASTWRNLWHSIPFLDFDMIPFHSNIPDISIRDARELFLEFISQTLIHRLNSGFHLRKFKLRFCYRNRFHVNSYIDSWLEDLTKCKVVELDLQFQLHSYHQNQAIIFEEEDNDNPFLLYSPQFLSFSDSSVKVLKLLGVSFRIPEEALSLKFDSIKEVHLQYFLYSDKDIEHLLASCVNLESLSLVSGVGCNHLKVVSQKLKYFKLFEFHVLNFRDESSIEICTPSLVSINLAYVYAEKFLMKNTPSLVEAEVIFHQRSWWDLAYWTYVVGCLRGIERLTVQHMWPWSLLLPDNMDRPFTTSEELEISTPEGETFDIPLYVPEDFFLKLKPRLDVFNGAFEFPNLKHLELLTGFSEDDVCGLEFMFVKFPQLTSVVLISKYESSSDDDMGEIEDSEDIVFFLPRLKFVVIKEFGATKNQMIFVDLLKTWGGALERITAYPKMMNGRLQPPVILHESPPLNLDELIDLL